MQDGIYTSQDMLSLKGQVWPGMGKMDLANEDMKRTRNQRKPNSVIEKMRRTSEGIEPMQVVMTSEFEVERVKGVYDSSSPVPGQEEEVQPRRCPCSILRLPDITDPEEANKTEAQTNGGTGGNLVQCAPRWKSPPGAKYTGKRHEDSQAQVG